MNKKDFELNHECIDYRFSRTVTGLVRAVKDPVDPTLAVAKELAYSFCGGRGCEHYFPQYHTEELMMSYLAGDNDFMQSFLPTVATLIDILPSQPFGEDAFHKEVVVINALGLAKTFRSPRIFQDCLDRAVRERRFNFKAKHEKHANFPELLYEAVVTNQGDRRHQERWLQGIRKNKIPDLPGGSAQAFEALMQIPQSEADPTAPPLDAIAQAGQVFYDTAESRSNYYKNELTNRYFWPIVGRFGLSPEFLDNLAKTGVNECWDPDITRALEDFRKFNIPKALEIAEVVSYYKSYEQELAKQLRGGKSGRQFSEYQRAKIAAEATAVYLRHSCADSYPAVRQIQIIGEKS